jgi:LEA14-like dessication related protein
MQTINSKKKRQFLLPPFLCIEMKTMKFFVPVFITACLLGSCSKPLAPKYLGYQNFRLAKASFGDNILTTDIRLYNPNNYPLQLKSASMDVYFNNNFLGHSSLDTLIVLPGKDTTNVRTAATTGKSKGCAE